MAKARRRSPSGTVSYSHREDYRGHELETDCTAAYDYEPGEKGVRYGDNACPGSDPEITSLVVTVDATGEDITDEADLDSIKDSILEEIGSSDAGDDDDSAYEDARDRRLMGED